MGTYHQSVAKRMVYMKTLKIFFILEISNTDFYVKDVTCHDFLQWCYAL
jgi:hypothetical protein